MAHSLEEGKPEARWTSGNRASWSGLLPLQSQLALPAGRELGHEDRQESSKEQAVQGEQFIFVLHFLLRDPPGSSSWGCFLGYKDSLTRVKGGSAGTSRRYSTGKLQMCAY